MGFDFGNIHGMTKADFQAAIEYYQNKVAQMEADESINPGAKAWFLKRYNARLQTLEKGFERLQEVINDLRSRTPSVYVNEATATINSLSGTTFNDSTTFSNMRQSKAKYGWGQFFRALGGLLLPVVGTIPFVISAVKARRRYKAVQSAITRENIDMQNFANERRRSYDATLATNTPFTELEMQELLSNPAELQRLTDLTNPTDPTLNPAEKKILASKLAAVRSYAQKNGYTIATGSALDNARFNTSADKIRTNPLAAGPIGASTDLKDAHDKIKTLEGLKTQAEALLAADPENDDIKSLVSTINSNISTLKGQAQAHVTTGLTGLDADLTAAAAVGAGSMDETPLKNSNSQLDTAYNNKTRFGGSSRMTVAEAKAYAEAIGLDVSVFDKSKQKYDNAKAANNANLSAYTTFDNAYAEAKRIIDAYDLSFIASLDSASTVKAVEQLNLAQGKLNQLQALLPNINDPARRSNYQALLADLNARKDAADVKTNDFEADEKGFSALESMYNNANAVLTRVTPLPDIHELNAHKQNIDTIISTINGLPKPWGDKFTTLYSNAQMLSGKYDQEISAKNVAAKDIDGYITTINGISVTADFDKNKHILESILDIIDTPEYKDGLDESNKRKLVSAIATAKSKIIDIDEAVQEQADAVEEAKRTKADKQAARAKAIEEVEQKISDYESQFRERLKKFSEILSSSSDAKLRRTNLKKELVAIHSAVQNMDTYINSLSSLTPTDKKRLIKLAGLLGNEMNRLTSGLAVELI